MGDGDVKLGTGPMLPPPNPADLPDGATSGATGATGGAGPGVLPPPPVGPIPPVDSTLTRGVPNVGVQRGFRRARVNGASVRRGQTSEVNTIGRFLNSNRKAWFMTRLFLGVTPDQPNSGPGSIIDPPPMGNRTPAEYLDSLLGQNYPWYQSLTPDQKRDAQEVFLAANATVGALATGRIKPEELGEGGLLPRIMDDAIAVGRDPTRFGRMVLPESNHMLALYYMSRGQELPEPLKDELGYFAGKALESQRESLDPAQWGRGVLDRISTGMADRLNNRPAESAHWDRLEQAVASFTAPNDSPEAAPPPPVPEGVDPTNGDDEALMADLVRPAMSTVGDPVPEPGDPDFIGPLPAPKPGESDFVINSDEIFKAFELSASDNSFVKKDPKHEEIQMMIEGFESFDDYGDDVYGDEPVAQDEGPSFSEAMEGIDDQRKLSSVRQQTSDQTKKLADEVQEASSGQRARLHQDGAEERKKEADSVAKKNRDIVDEEIHRLEPDAPRRLPKN